MKKLEGKVAVITGGNSGIGLATAQQFVTDGAYVFITGRRQSELDAAVVEIGKNVTGVRGDVSNLADLDRLYSTVKKEKDQIDILFEIYNQRLDVYLRGFMELPLIETLK
jgi:NAD(P)-dependent dehydrogenase (short-subunit alcohol dehydrogenase family)